MAVPGAEDVYLTLLLSDTYLPGALVLAHSLRDAGTTKKLGVMVTLDSVSAEAITELKTVYDYVIPVPRIKNAHPANLSLMNRADLHSAFTKLNLWKQTSFRKIVYVDADVVAYRAPDELFAIEHAFSAAPDIGWPDLFNTGVMVLTPNMGDYYAMMAMADRGISFDGADQGLLNLHFKNSYNRISFTYNVTPSAHYQYVPAYRHFQSSINMVHFIGSDKPWFQGRYYHTGSSPFDEMIGRWWAVYDRHYRTDSPELAPSKPASELVQYLTKGEYQPRQVQATKPATSKTEREYQDDSQHAQNLPSHSYTQQHGFHAPPSDVHTQQVQDQHQQGHQDQFLSRDEQPHTDFQPGSTVQQTEHTQQSPSVSFSSSIEGREAEARKEQVPEFHPPEPEQKKVEHPITFSDWDAQRHPPPTDSKPEAANFPSTIYEMSRDTAPFIPPVRYPSPPKGMYYEVPRGRPAPPTEKPRTIFPWEGHQPAPSRKFFDKPSESTAPSVTTESSTVEAQSEPVTPTTPTITIMPSDPWSSFPRANAWDEVPGIERYVEKMQRHRRTGSLKSPGKIGMPSPRGKVNESEWRRHGMKLTDFPTEVERPSLPVTPAPIRRPKFWGVGGGPGTGEGDDDETLPAAQGVPSQSDWDPVAQLQKLAKQQSELLLQRLGGEGDSGGSGRGSNLPPRPVPFGSEKLTSPTYVAPTAKVLSPQPVKGSASSSAVRGITSDEEVTPTGGFSPAQAMEQPSYTGPGPAFEKGESYVKAEPETKETTLPSHAEIGPAVAAGEASVKEGTLAPAGTEPTSTTTIALPSYAGPGPAFEKGES